jgi:hypothetical protein
VKRRLRWVVYPLLAVAVLAGLAAHPKVQGLLGRALAGHVIDNLSVADAFLLPSGSFVVRGIAAARPGAGIEDAEVAAVWGVGDAFGADGAAVRYRWETAPEGERAPFLARLPARLTLGACDVEAFLPGNHAATTTGRAFLHTRAPEDRDLRLVLNSPLVRHVPTGGEIFAATRVTAAFRLQEHGGRLSVTGPRGLALTVPGARVHKIALGTVRARIGFRETEAARVVDVPEVRFVYFDAPCLGSGSVVLAKTGARYAARLRIDGLDVERWTKAMPGDQVRGTGRLAGSIEVTGTEAGIATLKGDFRAAEPGTLELRRLALALAKRQLERGVKDVSKRRVLVEALEHFSYSTLGLAFGQAGDRIVLDLALAGRGRRSPQPIEAKLRLDLCKLDEFWKSLARIREVPR